MTGSVARPHRALVTGASAGLGAALCVELALKGWLVIGASRRGTIPSTDAASQHRIEGRQLGVTDAAAMQALVRDLDDTDRIDLHVLNAGITPRNPLKNCRWSASARSSKRIFGALSHLRAPPCWAFGRAAAEPSRS